MRLKNCDALACNITLTVLGQNRGISAFERRRLEHQITLFPGWIFNIISRSMHTQWSGNVKRVICCKIIKSSKFDPFTDKYLLSHVKSLTFDLSNYIEQATDNVGICQKHDACLPPH